MEPECITASSVTGNDLSLSLVVMADQALNYLFQSLADRWVHLDIEVQFLLSGGYESLGPFQ